MEVGILKEFQRQDVLKDFDVLLSNPLKCKHIFGQMLQLKPLSSFFSRISQTAVFFEQLCVRSLAVFRECRGLEYMILHSVTSFHENLVYRSHMAVSGTFQIHSLKTNKDT
jgi:hypothetical protein